MAATNYTLLDSRSITLADSASAIMRGTVKGKIGIHIPTGTTVTVYKTGAPNAVVNDDAYAGWIQAVASTAGPAMVSVDGPCTAIKITAGGAGGGGDVYVQYAD